MLGRGREVSAGKGCVAPIVAPHLVKPSFRMHAAMGAALPATTRNRETGKVAAVKDQGQSSACEGHSGSGAIETAFALAGDPLGFIPSEIDLYRGLRAVDRARHASASHALPKLTDDGGMTEDALTYLAHFGIRPRAVAHTSDGRNSDVELATVNAEPAFGDLELDALHLIVGPYAVDPGAADMEHQVQAAIAAGIPVRVDAFVDSVFEDWAPGKAPVPAPNMSDPQGGGHAIYVVDYAPGFYFVRNSWSETWGEGGDVRVSPEWLRKAWGLYPFAVKRAS